MKEAYDMTWSEFRIRSFGFNRVRKWEMQLFRELAYEVHTLKYMFGKRTPPSKERFWPIGGKDTKGITKEQREAFLKARAEFKKKRYGDGAA